MSPAGADSAATSQRRRWPRQPGAGKIFCYVKIAPEKVIGPMPVANLSTGGIALAIKEALALPAVTTVQLFSRPRRTWTEHRFEVAYLLPQPGGGLLVGGAFIREIPGSEIPEYL